MLNPNIGKLIKNSGNRYRLVLDVAKTAREISGEAAEKGEAIARRAFFQSFRQAGGRFVLS